jgi:hypothetical protein
MNPAAGPPGTPVTITMTVANQGSLVGSVNTSLNIQPAGSINLTTPVPQVLTIDTSAPGGPTMNAVFNGTIANNASGNITVNGVLDLNGPTGVPYNRAPFGAGEFVVLLPNQTCTSNFQVETPVVICESLSSDTVVITPCAPVNFTLRLRNTSNINGTVDVRVDANPANGFQCGPPLFQQSNVAVNANSVRVLNFNCNLSCTPPPQIDLVTTLTGVGGTRVPDPSPAVCRLTLRGGQVIPTLSEWGLIALTLALGAGLFLVRRRTV